MIKRNIIAEAYLEWTHPAILSETDFMVLREEANRFADFLTKRFDTAKSEPSWTDQMSAAMDRTRQLASMAIELSNTTKISLIEAGELLRTLTEEHDDH